MLAVEKECTKTRFLTNSRKVVLSDSLVMKAVWLKIIFAANSVYKIVTDFGMI